MNDFDDLMRHHDPARDLPELSPATRTAILDRAVEGTKPAEVTSLPSPTSRADEHPSRRPEAASSGTGMISQPRSTKRSNRRRRLLSGGWKAALAVAASSLVVAGVTQLGLTGPASAEASQVLFLAADASADPPAQPDQWWEITTTGTTLNGYADSDDKREITGRAIYLVTTSRTTYLAVDGERPSWLAEEPSTIIRRISGPEINPVINPPLIWTSNLSPNEEPASWQMPNPAWLAELPRDTEALRERLYADSAGHGSGTDDSAYTYAADVLRTGTVPADLRAALFRVIQTIPGTSITDPDVLLDGRRGVAIGRSDVFGMGRELVFDVHTGELIGERSKVQRVPGGERILLESGYARRVVNEIPADIQRDAQRMSCRVNDYGGVECVQ